MSRFLVTTALEETWPEDSPILFLGEWCRLHSRRERWSSMDGPVLPYHWEDPGKFSRDYEYISWLHERLLPRLAQRMNEIHGVDHDLRYWRILLGPWLGLFIQIAFDRWESVRAVLSRADVGETIVLTGDEASWVPNDMGRFAQFMTGDEWNHRIFSMLLGQFTDVPCTPKQVEAEPASPPIRMSGVKQGILAGYAKLMNRFVRPADAFFLASFLPLAEELSLQMRLGQVPRLWRPEPAPEVAVDWTRREWDWRADYEDEFEAIALALIPKQIPRVFLEGYEQLIDRVNALPWPERPKVIFSSNSLWYDTVAMAYAAEKSGGGSPIAYAQHGGNYWVTKLYWGECHEVAASDKFFSWGFDEPSTPKIAPVGYIKPYFRRTRNSRHGTLLLVTHNNPRYSYMMYSGQKGTQVLTSYLESAFAFVDSVLPSCGDDLVVRLTTTEYGWGFFERWQERFPAVSLDRGVAKMRDLIGAARLMVCTYCSTAFLEALASDIPVMVFWDPAVDPISDSAVPYFEELQRVGVFHATPESAAGRVSEIWEDVDGWWRSQAVQVAVLNFKNRYCRTSDDRVGRLEDAFRDVITSFPSNHLERA